MRRLGTVALVVAVVVAAAWLGDVAGAGAVGGLTETTRVEGQFTMTGRVTIARHIRGEHVGERVLRTWTFTPLCSSGPCERIGLARQRTAGSDSLVLKLRAADYYVGRGRFYAPLRCGGRLRRRGELVPFTIAVRITGTALRGGQAVATRVDAAYTNRRRLNRTRCVAVPGHDSATYHGTLVGTAV